MSDTVSIQPVWFPFPAVDGIFNTFVKLVVKISSPDLAEPIEQIFVDSENRTTGNAFDVITGTVLHQEVTFYYQNILGLHSYKPQVSDFSAGIAAIPKNLRVAFEGVCSTSTFLRIIASGVHAITTGAPWPDGQYQLTKYAGSDFWTAIANNDTLLVSCFSGLYFAQILHGETQIFEPANSVAMNVPNENFGDSASGTITVTP